MKHEAEIIREYGPFPGIKAVHGVSYDGAQVWLATGTQLQALDPDTGVLGRAVDLAADAGTAFDGTHLFQIAGEHIRKLDPATGKILATIPAPAGGDASGLAWAEGSLWVGQYKDRAIVQINPETGAILRRIASDRFVTGISWVDGELWHGTWEEDRSELRHVDPASGGVIDTIELPEGIGVSGLESDGAERFFCGGGPSGKLRVVRRSTAPG
ncbi:glutamine cyclotransferase [Paracoccus ravus]|uniref:glutamine cyclotransferase n=1 Tax=Paracoccus ravus TaxID=2447760 RepID=UPI00106E4765|nr:glutamine cyclotransferase [Paracoccus ravus]